MEIILLSFQLSLLIWRLILIFSLFFFAKSNLIEFCLRLFLIAPDDFKSELFSHRVISDKVHRLLVKLFYFRSDRFVLFLSLKTIFLLVSIGLDYTGTFARFRIENCSQEEQLFAELNLFCSG